jgi:hypothetical protein
LLLNLYTVLFWKAQGGAAAVFCFIP